jgi:hypothetical protein
VRTGSENFRKEGSEGFGVFNVEEDNDDDADGFGVEDFHLLLWWLDEGWNGGMRLGLPI